MFDAYSFDLADASALAMADIQADCPGFAAHLNSFVQNEQFDEVAYASH